MKNHKILVDRKPLNENYIQSKQDFGKVLKGVSNLKPPIWKSAWFYGPVGLATVALTISATTIQANEMQDKENNLSSLSVEKQVIRKEKPKLLNNIDIHTVPIVEHRIEKVERKKVPYQYPKKEEEKKSLEEKKEINIELKNQVIEEKTTLKITFPNINNVFTGDITFSNLCSENGITCGTKKITSFSLQYFNGKIDVSEDVEGNRISVKSCELIEKYNKGTMIYITNVKGVDEDGNNISFPSLNYIPRY